MVSRINFPPKGSLNYAENLSPHGYLQNLFSEAEDAVLDVQFKPTNSTDKTGIKKTVEMRKTPGIIYYHH